MSWAIAASSCEAIRELDAPAPAAAADAAERRPLTLMFCDLVGSTTLSASLDPEDLRAVINAYHRCCAETVERHGGFVAKYMGDGVLVYFGYPQAREHDAEHAVEAGLGLVEAVPRLVTPAGAPLQVRVGIATGMVVVGDLVGSGQAQERGVVGETPNLAARLQAIAEPNAVVIAAGTRRLLGDLFELRDLGPQDLKGIPGPVPASGRAGHRQGRKPLRGFACRQPDPPGWPGGRSRDTGALLGEGCGGRRTGGAAQRRGRGRQVAADC